MDETPKPDDRVQHLIYDPAVGLTYVYEPEEEPPEPLPTDPAERARRLEALAASGAWVFIP